MAHRIGAWLLQAEFYLLTVVIVIFWYPDQRRIWSLCLIIPLLIARVIVTRRLWKSTKLDPVIMVLLVLCALNAFIAPYSFIAAGAGGLVMLGRPLMGITLAVSLVDRAYREQSMDGVLAHSVLLGGIVGFLALVSSQWTVKSSAMIGIINLLPQVRNVPQIGFNVNEIAGAMAYLTPLMAGIAVYFWVTPALSRMQRVLRVSSSVAFCLLWASTFLGQSRFAIVGILPMLAWIALKLVPKGRWRTAALGFVGFFVVAQVLILSGVLNPQAELLAERDQDSLSTRLRIWQSGLHIVSDYPLTGSGMNTFRIAAVRTRYPVEGYEGGRILPHAHNEWVQIATDLGIPGLMVFAWLYGAVGWMSRYSWRHGDPKQKAIALAAICGLLAHLIYAMGDAIPLWDRFAFVFWWVVGVAAAQYALVQNQNALENRNVVDQDPKNIESSLIDVQSA